MDDTPFRRLKRLLSEQQMRDASGSGDALPIREAFDRWVAEQRRTPARGRTGGAEELRRSEASAECEAA